jgi:hypothetical protein
MSETRDRERLTRATDEEGRVPWTKPQLEELQEGTPRHEAAKAALRKTQSQS